MALLADFLRDNTGSIVRVYADADGELNLTLQQLESDWSEPSYTIPTEGYEYRTLADSAGNTWYVYVVKVMAGDETHFELQISSTAPTAQPAGIWRDPEYGTNLVETGATVGNEIYLAFEDASATDWYVYPDITGELKISTTAPA